jgi:hypothetical protein
LIGRRLTADREGEAAVHLFGVGKRERYPADVGLGGHDVLTGVALMDLEVVVEARLAGDTIPPNALLALDDIDEASPEAGSFGFVRDTQRRREKVIHVANRPKHSVAGQIHVRPELGFDRHHELDEIETHRQ